MQSGSTWVAFKSNSFARAMGLGNHESRISRFIVAHVKFWKILKILVRKHLENLCANPLNIPVVLFQVAFAERDGRGHPIIGKPT